jgi:hypothetical protein
LDVEKGDVAACDGCLFVEWTLQAFLPKHVEEARTYANTESVDDALQFITDTLFCVHRFQGHRMRTINQQLALAGINKRLEAEAVARANGATDIIHTIKVNQDWKMKYNDKRLRESQLHNFGKRGSSWHENVATDFIYKDSTTKKVKISLDQIMAIGNKQDQGSVLAMLEALMRKFDEEFETRTNIVLFTDNAACYHGNLRTSFALASAK